MTKDSQTTTDDLIEWLKGVSVVYSRSGDHSDDPCQIRSIIAQLEAAAKLAPIVRDYIEEGYNGYVGKPVEAIAALAAWKEAGGQ